MLTASLATSVLPSMDVIFPVGIYQDVIALKKWAAKYTGGALKNVTISRIKRFW